MDEEKLYTETDLNSINDGNAIYTRIAKNLETFKTELTTIEKKQMALNDSISEFSAEEKKAHQIVNDLNAELHAIQRKIENLNLPGISDDYVDYFGVVADEINKLASESKETASRSNENQERVITSISEIFKETQKLLDVVKGVNDRTQNLAAAAQEIAASSDVILTTADKVKEDLRILTEKE